MKIKHLISSLLLAGVMALGVGAALNVRNESNKVDAASSLVGGQNLFLKVNNSNWTQANASFALYCFNSGSDNAWAWFDSPSHFSNDYMAATVPSGSWANIVIVRMNPNGSDSSNNYLNWNNKWNQTGDIAVDSNDTYTITGTGWDNPTYEKAVFSSKYSWNISHSNETDGSWTTTSTVDLSYKNDSEGAQFYNTNVSLSTGMKFDVVRSTDNAWFHSEYLENGGAVGEYFKKNNYTDADVLKGGKFEFYVKVKNNSVWTQVSSETLADTWASGFVSGVGCKAPYNAAPANWSSYATTYSSLPDGSKNILYSANASNASGASNVEKAAFMYDMCVAKYSSCAANQFMVDSHNTPRTAHRVNTPIAISSITSSTATVVVIIVTLVSVTAIGAYVYLRRRKAN